MKTIYTLIVFVQFFALTATAADIYGVVKNNETGEPLPDANIKIADSRRGTTTNAKGEYVIKDIETGDYELVVSYMGFATKRISFQIERDQKKSLNVMLTPTSIPMGEISVTSTHYKMELKEVPIPINVVNDERIRKTMPRTVSDALLREPGLSLGRDGVWGTHVNIRGLSKNNLVVLVDGNRIDTATDLDASFSMVDMNDIARVEVIKGAASSLYGTGAIGGAVNIITQDGWYSEDPYIKARLSGGYSTVNNSSNGYATAFAGGEHWYTKVSGMLRSADNMQTPEGTLENSQYSDNNISARLGFRPLKNHEIKLNYQNYDAQNVGIPGGNQLFPSVAEVRYPKEKRDLFSIEYIGRDVADVLPKLSLKYFQQDILRDVENIPHVVKNMPTTPPKRVNMLKVLPRASHHTQGFQLQTDWVLFKNQHAILGLDAWQKELDSFRTKHMRIDVLNPNDDSVMKSIDRVIAERPLPLSTYRSIGVFAQDEIPLFNNRAKMTIGGRWDKIQVENAKTLNPVYEVVNGARNNSPDGQTVLWPENTTGDNSWSGNLSFLYHATSTVDLTATASRSFRSPYISERYQFIDLGNLVKIGDPHLQPENGYFSNIGLRMWKDKLSFAGDIFFNRINDMVVETATTYEGRSALIKTNVGQAELYGFDFRVDYRFSGSYALHFTGAYVYGQDIYENQPLPLIPPLNGRFGVTGPLTQFFSFEIAATMYDKQDRVADWEMQTPGYTYFDFYLTSSSFQLGQVQNRFFIGVENIFDTAYRNHLSTNRGEVAVEPGRNFSLRWQLSI